MENVKFEHLGYFEEYHSNGKFIGSINIEGEPSQPIGYNGKSTKIADKIILVGKKRIKIGDTYTVIVYPLCGKQLNKK